MKMFFKASFRKCHPCPRVAAVLTCTHTVQPRLIVAGSWSSNWYEWRGRGQEGAVVWCWAGVIVWKLEQPQHQCGAVGSNHQAAPSPGSRVTEPRPSAAISAQICLALNYLGKNHTQPQSIRCCHLPSLPKNSGSGRRAYLMQISFCLCQNRNQQFFTNLEKWRSLREAEGRWRR